MATNIDKDKISGIIREAAATYITPRFRALQDNEIKSKSSPSDLVTIADIETEEALTAILEKEYPGSVVIGEEAISAGTKDLSVLANKEGTIFVIDPVDGTNNFVHGRETFCVMVARIVNGKTEEGWIYDVTKDRMLFTQKGAGTFMNDERVTVSPNTDITTSRGYANAIFFPKRLRHHVKELDTTVGTLSSLHCSGHEYLNMALGKQDFSLSTKMKPWDHLAGALAVQEAGGVVYKWNGTTYEPQDELGGIIAAANNDIRDAIQSTLLNKIIEEEAVKDSKQRKIRIF